jgi:carbon monoxide dehydrogenase subunit G
MSFQSIVIIGVSAIAVLALVSLALPSSTRIERSKTVSAPPEVVFDLLSTTSGFQKINPYKDDEPNLKVESLGPDRGVGAGFSFEGKDIKGTQTITSLDKNSMVTMQIDLGSMGQPVQTFRFAKEGSGTRVTWATESAFGYNPIARVFGLFLDKMVGPTYERGLNNLDRVLASQAAVSQN